MSDELKFDPMLDPEKWRRQSKRINFALRQCALAYHDEQSERVLEVFSRASAALFGFMKSTGWAGKNGVESWLNSIDRLLSPPDNRFVRPSSLTREAADQRIRVVLRKCAIAYHLEKSERVLIRFEAAAETYADLLRSRETVCGDSEPQVLTTRVQFSLDAANRFLAKVEP